MSTLEERATVNFYQWESRGRGYFHFDVTVEVEPPYIPFIPISHSETKKFDDGRVPSLLKQFTNLLSPSKEESDEDVINEMLPTTVTHFAKRECITISFPKETDISAPLMQELLCLISFSEDCFSFEILAQNSEIKIQFTSAKFDSARLQSHLKAFFPTVVTQTRNVNDINFDVNEKLAIADFGLDNEFMLPINNTDNLVIDPLTSIIAILGTLGHNETAIFQIIFKGVTAPWSRDMLYAVSDGRGGSFFEGNPEFVKGTQEKVSEPLFGVIMRIGAQGLNEKRSCSIASDLVRTITTVSSSEYNRLIPLSNEGYKYDDHLRNIFYRTTNRIGFILNAKELAHFVHYPNKTVVSDKLGLGAKTKQQDNRATEGIYIGENVHHLHSHPVILDTETRLSHTHIIGVTGVGKSTLIANMIIADIEVGRGCAIFDPHGDICDDILKRIPKHRINDVIIIDPSDSNYPIGFNLLEAHTEAEKIVLSSDLVSAFKRHATAWGDNMTAVLQNAVNTILGSTRGGTLIELKRFLIEESFRNEYLTSVDDPSLHYYWHHEYPMVRKGIAPLLTRIDTFLRPKLVRYMLAQKSGVDISECLKDNKIVLLKLSQGLIGEQNSYLLGSLFLAKFNQAALARQSESREERSPYMLYLDEFQNFITPSIERILSGARKYALGITIVHQELGQIQDNSLLNSILSNPKIRICFRLGDNDAKRLESGFSYFKQSDLQNLSRGEAIMRIGSSNNDFNLTTFPLIENQEDYSDTIITSVRQKYASPKAEVEELLISLLPKVIAKSGGKKATKEIKKVKPTEEDFNTSDTRIEDSQSNISEEKRNRLIASENESLEIRTHTYLQSTIKKLGQDRNFIATIEAPTKDGGRIDILLERDGLKIGFEISETNKPAYEVENIKKCLRAGCIPIVMVSKSKKHLQAIEKLASEKLSTKDIQFVRFIQPDGVAPLLNSLMILPKKNEEMVKGYRVVTEYEMSENDNVSYIKSKLKRLFKSKK
ncbi:MAG: type IV secretory system conjugative DNA transfer family protein [Patiriisocius sp.]|uniref:type IV secretory system conjugative DNA transfer family protein n=1 Tax=Patiriisocius sp. TaxID=2822396 RepID=UPI003EF8E310